ncbi:MAG: thioredoxin-like selenoprotein, partial [Anaerolineales bacterium]
MSRFFLILALLILLTACAAPTGDGGPLTVDRGTPTLPPTSTPTPKPPETPTPTPTPTEAP